ncbi:hypothetical protein BT63DRAFT_454728 [Microthyrium microscopicum]|uniref:Uncharacterized protein n=1 Tax=Microthyrium microscopicum TaxID=703497 RepID=A0A6A6UDX7_9PEZI|nr:hypothetical protein BT63DRAFT_454728 [Microthyrium microscopicum]
MPEEPTRIMIKETDVTLAFPLDEFGMPLISNQPLFGALPLPSFGHKFIIHADLLLKAGEQGILHAIPWNVHLIMKVAWAFFKAISSFLGHTQLINHWVQYLPLDDSLSSHAWRVANETLFEVLRPLTIFKSDVPKIHLAKDLRIVPLKYRDLHGVPLLRDLGDEKCAALGEFAYRMVGDLESSEPRFKTRSNDVGWSSRMADLISTLLDQDEYVAGFKAAPFIPLKNGSWTSAKTTPYLAIDSCGSIGIPEDFGLSIVEPNAVSVPSRKKLFLKLGVKEYFPKDVFPLIEQTYRTGTVSRNNSFSHIKFLFWNHDKLPHSGVAIKIRSKDPHAGPAEPDMFLIDDRSRGWTYNPWSTFNKHSAIQLLGATLPAELAGCCQYPDFGYHLQLAPMEVRHLCLGTKWFITFIGALEYPQLCSRVDSKMRSAEVEYIAKHKPQHLLRVLEASWLQYYQSEDWDDYFKAVEVPILESDQPRELQNTWLPLPKLREIVRRYDLEVDFGFLAELTDIGDLGHFTFRFLDRLGVGMGDDVSFWLQLLRQIRRNDTPNRKSVFEIYERIQSLGNQHGDQIRKAFDEESLFLNTIDGPHITWRRRSHMAWDGPSWLSTPTCLGSNPQYSHLRQLFKVTLALNDVAVKHFLDALKVTKMNSAVCFPRIGYSQVKLTYAELSKAVDGGAD